MNLLKSTATLAIGLTVTLIPASAKSLTVEEVINPRQANTGWVTDMADILDSDTEKELNHIITQQERADGTEIAIVTVPETAPAKSPKAFATELFNYWGIGKAELNNGILFLISKGDNRVEIETGYGIPARLPNSTVGIIIDRTILPQYRQGDFDNGTLQGTQALIEALQPQGESVKENATFKWQNIAIVLLTGTGTIAVLSGVLSLIKRKSNVYVKPANNLSLQRHDIRTVCCAACQQPMNRVKVEHSKAQSVAQKLGGVSYRGYQCLNCASNSETHSTVAYFSNSDRYDDCPKCQELTVTKTGEVITPATEQLPGELVSKMQCHCCGYYQEEIIEILPKSEQNRSSNHSHRNGANSGYYNYYGGSGYSGNSSSGGSFGGGASGGDGAGGSW